MDMAVTPDITDQAVERIRPEIEQLALTVWDTPEIGLHEVKSSHALQEVLTAHGFTITSTGTAGEPTAFVAEWGAGAPRIGFLPEYDALPGLGNEAVPRQEPRRDGQTAGHGCGHNLLGAALVGAAIALKDVMAAQGLPGTIRVYGCAAEETEGAKIYMAREGLFDDLDAALHWHPAPIAAVANIRTSATNAMKIEFHGRTAHAGNEPWKGRSALHAAELFAHAVNVMREHLEPTARVHYIYEAAGVAPNIVPDYARVWLVARDQDRARVSATTDWLKVAAEGAALATQTRATFGVYFGMYDLLPNAPLAERMQTHLTRIGTPQWTEEEQEFARECQRNIGAEPQGLANTVVPLLPEPTVGGSTDVGDVSWQTPTMGVALPAMPLGVSLHTWPVTACGGMSIGLKGCVQAARVLAAAAAEIMTDATLREAAQEDFVRRTAGKPYISPLPADQRHPIGLPEWMNSDGFQQIASEMAQQPA